MSFTTDSQWEAVIGLEVHVQLATQSKIFSGAPTTYGAEPNTQACAIDLGLPGVLPVLNKRAVEMAVKFGLAVNATINSPSVFARKNYFYADLPKGYQISQFDRPIVAMGQLEIQLPNDTTKIINITRAHLEEDAGKSVHDIFPHASGIDLNRAGTPLLEIVSEPELTSAEEAVAYLKTLHNLVRFLEISDGNMQEGSFRCDVNVSVRKRGDSRLGTRTECKNLNSFRFVEKAIEYEVERQIMLLEAGQAVTQETRLFDPQKNETRTLRSKEDAQDYRYFPDPDLLPVEIASEWLKQIQNTLPELPWSKKKRYMDTFNLTPSEAQQLVLDKTLTNYFEETLCHTQHAKLACNWILGEISSYLNQQAVTITEQPVSPKALATLIERIEDNTLSSKTAKEVFNGLCQHEGSVDEIIAKKGLKQISDTTALQAIVDTIIAESPQQVAQYLEGKEKIFGYFVGQAMKATQGKANPGELTRLFKEKLGNQ